MLGEAEQALRDALTLNPELLSGISYLSLLYLESGGIEEAWDIARRALSINLNSADVWIYLATSIVSRACSTNRAKAIARAGRLEPHSPRLRAIDSGFVPRPYFCTDPFLGEVRGQALFENAIAKAAERHDAFWAGMTGWVPMPTR